MPGDIQKFGRLHLIPSNTGHPLKGKSREKTPLHHIEASLAIIGDAANFAKKFHTRSVEGGKLDMIDGIDALYKGYDSLDCMQKKSPKVSMITTVPGALSYTTTELWRTTFGNVPTLSPDLCGAQSLKDLRFRIIDFRFSSRVSAFSCS
jgi:hypothetical protein